MTADGLSAFVQTDLSPDRLTAEQVIYGFLYRQKDYTAYQITTTGCTRASKGVLNYTQQIQNVSIKRGDEYFSQSISSSMFVNMAHQCYAKGGNDKGKVAFRNATEGKITTVTRAEYRSIYGISPDDLTLGGYTVNRATVRSWSKDLSDPSEPKYAVVLKPDSDEGLGAMKAQMKQFGGLNELPVFSHVKLTLVMKNDWEPVRLISEASYTVSIAVLGTMHCRQILTGEYSGINGSVRIPDADFFNATVGTAPEGRKRSGS